VSLLLLPVRNRYEQLNFRFLLERARLYTLPAPLAGRYSARTEKEIAIPAGDRKGERFPSGVPLSFFDRVARAGFLFCKQYLSPFSAESCHRSTLRLSLKERRSVARSFPLDDDYFVKIKLQGSNSVRE